MKFRLAFSLFLYLLVNIAANEFPNEVKCVDKECTQFISDARVLSPIKNILGNELKSVNRGQTVKIFAKSADPSNTLFGIEFKNLRGFVDASFLKELSKDKNNDLIKTKVPDKFLRSTETNSQSSNEEADPTEDSPEIKSPPKPHNGNPDVKDSTEDRAEIDKNNAAFQKDSSKFTDSTTQIKVDKSPASKDNTEPLHRKYEKQTKEDKGLPIPVKIDDKQKSVHQPNLDLIQNPISPPNNLHTNEKPVTKETVPGNHPPSKLNDLQKNDQVKLPKANTPPKTQQQTEEKLPEANTPPKTQQQTEEKLPEANTPPKTKQQTEEKLPEANTPPKTQQQTEEKITGTVEKKITESNIPSTNEYLAEKQNVQEQEMTDHKPTLNSEEKEFIPKEQRETVSNVNVPDNTKTNELEERLSEPESTKLSNEESKPSIDKESLPQVPETLHSTVDNKFGDNIPDSPTNEVSDQPSDSNSQSQESIPKLESPVVKSDLDVTIVEDKHSNKSELPRSDSFVEPKSPTLEDTSDSNGEDISIDRKTSQDPWIFHNAETQFSQCIRYLSNESGTFKTVKYIWDSMFKLLNEALSYLPESVGVLIRHDIPKLCGLSYEFTIVSSFCALSLCFMSVTFRCCLCRKDWKKEITQCRDALLTLERRLEEKNKANIEFAEWNSRLAKQIKEYEAQIELLQSDSSIQVKELQKQYEIMDGCYTKSQSELERLRGELMSAESQHIDERRALEEKLEEETTRLSNCIAEYEEKTLLNQGEYERQVAMVSELSDRQEQLISQMNAYYDQMVVMKKESELHEEEKIRFEEHIKHLNSELISMQENFQELSVFEALLNQENTKIVKKNGSDDDDEEDDDDDEEEENEIANGKNSDDDSTDEKNKILEKVKDFIDASKLRSELNQCVEKLSTLESRLRAETDSRKDAEEKLSLLEFEKQTLHSDRQMAELNSLESQKKLDILTQYFKERETEMQKLLGEQEVLKSMTNDEASSFKAKSEILDNEMKASKEKLFAMRKELEDSERAYRRQVVELEKRAHENWLAARASEREVKELKEETQLLRQRLLEAERSKLPMPPMGMPPGLLSSRFPRPPPMPPSSSGTTSPPMMFSSMLPPPPIRPGFPLPPNMSHNSMPPPSDDAQSDRDRPPSRTSAATSGLSHRMPSLSGGVPQGLPPLPMPPMGIPLPPGMRPPPHPPFGVMPPFSGGNMPPNMMDSRNS